MKLIYSQGFSKNEKLEWKPVVFSNIIQSFQIISEAMEELGIAFENPDNEVRMTPPQDESRRNWSTSRPVHTTRRHQIQCASLLTIFLLLEAHGPRSRGQ